jgi:hypothetical protein
MTGEQPHDQSLYQAIEASKAHLDGKPCSTRKAQLSFLAGHAPDPQQPKNRLPLELKDPWTA